MIFSFRKNDQLNFFLSSQFDQKSFSFVFGGNRYLKNFELVTRYRRLTIVEEEFKKRVQEVRYIPIHVGKVYPYLFILIISIGIMNGALCLWPYFLLIRKAKKSRRVVHKHDQRPSIYLRARLLHQL